MAREARKRSTQASRQLSHGRSPLPGWVWGLLGLSVGLFVALLVYLQHPAPNGAAAVSSLLRPHASDTAGVGGQSTGHTPAANNELTHPRFEFYKLLPDQEVGVPAPEQNIEPTPAKHPSTGSSTNAEHPRPQQTTATTPRNTQGTSAGYLLQAGSFRHLDEADQLKAKLALLGVEASIQNVELARGETWHRVRVGPFSDRQHLSEIRERLQENKIHTIVLKHGG